VHAPLLPARLRDLLASRNVRLIEAAPSEYEGMATNLLALEPYVCVMLEGNPETQRKLEAAGCKVTTFRGEEICRKAEGGPTCLTLPLLRSQ
jgi:N-dimethylarginine dimethylaminohydrolase